VPLGALLSGGVDSSTVVAMMASQSSRPVKTFSIGFSSADFNEAGHAKTVAQTFGTEHYELTVEPEIEQTVDHLTHMMEEPFGDSSMVPTYHVCRMARQHVTVALAGDGGDELFAGYDRYSSYLRWSKLKLFPFGTGSWYRGHIHPHTATYWRGRRFAYNLSLPPIDRYLDRISLLPPSVRERSLFSADFLQSISASPSPYERAKRYLDSRQP